MPKAKNSFTETKTFEKPVILTVEELADYLKVSKWTLQDWRLRGTGPKFIYVNNVKKYYRLDDVLEWMEQRTITSSADKEECMGKSPQDTTMALEE